MPHRLQAGADVEVHDRFGETAAAGIARFVWRHVHYQGYERIAVVPIGYADGFRRKPNNWGEVLVRGQRAPIVGRVCMDQCMINVTHLPEVKMGDEVVLIGAQGDDRIRAEDVAVKLGTNNYETVSLIMARVPRMYLAE